MTRKPTRSLLFAAAALPGAAATGLPVLTTGFACPVDAVRGLDGCRDALPAGSRAASPAPGSTSLDGVLPGPGHTLPAAPAGAALGLDAVLRPRSAVKQRAA